MLIAISVEHSTNEPVVWFIRTSPSSTTSRGYNIKNTHRLQRVRSLLNALIQERNIIGTPLVETTGVGIWYDIL